MINNQNNIILNITKLFLLCSCLILLFIPSYTNKSAKHPNQLQPLKAITGGTEYPDQVNPPSYLAAIYQGENPAPICSAVFINNSYILTAYHCFEGKNLADIRVAYTGQTSSGYSYPETDIDNVTRYKDLDLALVKLKHTFPNPPVSRAFIYHGYSFNKFNLQAADEIEEFGYGFIYDDGEGTIQTNDNSILKTITGVIFDFIAPVSQLKIETEDGATTSADSGGPIEYQHKLVAIATKSNVKLQRTSAILLTPDVLKWIATSIKEPIFKNPIENGVLVKEDDNSVVFKGWGTIQTNEIIQVYKLDGTLITNCNDFSTSVNNGWLCRTKLEGIATEDTEYTAYIYNQTSHQFGDQVDFEINPYGRNLTIIHPAPPETDEDIYTYHVEVGQKYIIRGTGTPGDTIHYALTRLDSDSHTPNEDPCIPNYSDSIIPDNGQWQCQLNMGINQEQYYMFEAYVPPKQQDIISLVNTRYILNPDITTSIKITKPTENEEVNPSHITKILISKNNGFKNIIYNLKIGDNDTFVFRDLINAEESTIEVNIRSPQATDLSKAHLVVSIYNNDEDSFPLASVSMDYFVKGLKINFTSPIVDQQIYTGDSVLTTGTVNLSQVMEDVSHYQVEVSRLADDDRYYSFYCVAKIINNDHWECSGKKDFKASHTYTLKAILVDKLDEKSITNTTVKIKIIAHPINIDTPPHLV